ncbi:MAG TPA: hypothetical protein VGM75_03780 [Pseudonocardiaceae bacterium]
MTGPDLDRLYRLLPAYDRQRDADVGEPMRALLAIMTEQAVILESDIAGLYANWFIETCQDWVAPYLGDLVGYRMSPTATDVLKASSTVSAKLLAALAPRRDVANTIPNRRRKGTLALLDQLAEDVANWPARAVEFHRLLHGTAPVRFPDAAEHTRFVDVRKMDALDRINTPFDDIAHTVAAPYIDSHRRIARHNVPNVGLFAWRLKVYPMLDASAHCEDADRGRYRFSVLGNDTPLMNLPVAEPSPTHIADESNLPVFIRRRAFEDRTADYYGPGKSIAIYLGPDRELVPLHRIVAADLTDWAYRPTPNQVAVDPVLGRIAFPARYAPEDGVWVDYHYGFADDLGGGQYHRDLATLPDATTYRVGPGQKYDGIMSAVRAWREDKETDPAKAHAIIEITDSDAYEERELVIYVDPGDRLVLRAAQGARPVIRLFDWHSNRPESLRITGWPPEDEPAAGVKPATVTFDGLLVTGRGVRITGQVGEFRLQHSTLVPGWSLDEGCRPQHAAEASLELDGIPRRVCVERSVLGSILVDADEVDTEPLALSVQDSIIDATEPSRSALSASDCRPAYLRLTMRRCTVIGSIWVHAVRLLENSIVLDNVDVVDRQSGCVRFCWLPDISRTPRRFHCVSDVPPRFDSLRYGDPTYGRLRLDCPQEISRGADDDSEIGVYHDLYQPQRADTLRSRLDDYTPATHRVGILFAS